MPDNFIILAHEGSSVQHKAALLSNMPGVFFSVPDLPWRAPRSFPSALAPLQHPSALLSAAGAAPSRAGRDGSASATGGGARSAPPLIGELI